MKNKKNFLENCYIVVGYSDKLHRAVEKYIEVKDIKNNEFDFVYITSTKYFLEIKEELIHMRVEEKKIKMLYDILGDFRNSEIKKKWIIDKLNEIPNGNVILDAKGDI